MRQFQRELTLTDGTRLLGQISLYPAPSVRLLTPTRRLIVPIGAPEYSAKVLRTPTDELYLIADEMTDYAAKQKSHILIKITDEETWVRTQTLTDPVTDLPRDEEDVPLGLIRFHLQQLNLKEDVLRIPEARFEAVTGEEIKVGDKLGPYRVLDVEKRLGVYFAQVH